MLIALSGHSLEIYNCLEKGVTFEGLYLRVDACELEVID
jgi:hypothetical protein